MLPIQYNLAYKINLLNVELWAKKCVDFKSHLNLMFYCVVGLIIGLCFSSLKFAAYFNNVSKKYLLSLFITTESTNRSYEQ